MARIKCRCGAILSNGLAPNNIELIVFTDKEWDKIMSVDTIETWKIPLPKVEVWRCFNCGTVYAFEDGNDIPIKVYTLEK